MAPNLKEFEWAGWDGKTYEPPVPGHWLVEIRTVDGNYNAGKAKVFIWEKGETPHQITHYRVIRMVDGDNAVPTRDGWVEWKGGPRPLVTQIMCEVKFRDGAGRKDFAGKFRWEWSGNYTEAVRDIVSYRILPFCDGPLTRIADEAKLVNRHDLAAAARALVNEVRQIEGPGGKMTDIWTVSRPALRGLIDALMAHEKEVF